MAEGERDGGAEESGPLVLPEDLRPRAEPRWAWTVAVAVVVLSLILYAFTRPPSAPRVPHQPAPTWGGLNLVQVARTEAKAAGDPSPRAAVWVSTSRGDALQLLTGQAGSGAAESEYVLAVQGHFREGSGPSWLAGSLANGPRLILLVRAFDGTVDGRMITAASAPDLSHLGPVQPLRLRWL